MQILFISHSAWYFGDCHEILVSGNVACTLESSILPMPLHGGMSQLLEDFPQVAGLRLKYEPHASQRVVLGTTAPDVVRVDLCINTSLHDL